ncbi:MAG: hypothetical protein KC550_07640, partial [Nanoarchaeota archaeon]|nr:hypothetical protein [Nanoarchaeota archaeon]
MSKPQLLSAVDNENKLKLTIDPLLESITCFIVMYLANGTQRNGVYENIIKGLEDLTFKKNFLPKKNFIYDIDLWAKYMKMSKRDIAEKAFYIDESHKSSLEKLAIHYQSYPKEQVPHLNEQEIFDYATIMFMEDFFRTLDGRDNKYYNFQRVKDVLKNDKLDIHLKRVLKDPSRI